MKKRIRVKFVGFWPDFEENNNFLINALRKHYEVVLSEEPQYLFSSCFSDDYLDYDCVRIFYTGENLCPDFNAFDYAIGFEHMEYGDRYLRYPNYRIPELYGQDFRRMLDKHRNASEALKEKTGFCSFVVSRGGRFVAEEREVFFRKLSEYKRVDSGGKFLNNIGEKDGVRDKLGFQSVHKFAIAFENSSHPGYTTEKLVQAFAARTVPVYWGDPLIAETFNEQAFINCHRYQDFDEVIEEVKRLDQDEDAYLAMLSAPALRTGETGAEAGEALEKFVVHIVDMDVGNAYRRDLVGWNRRHVDGLREVRRMRRSVFWKIANVMGILR